MAARTYLIDERNYTVVCAGVRQGNLLRGEALKLAEKLRDEWAATGFNLGRGRKAQVYYRDGSLVATFEPFSPQQ